MGLTDHQTSWCLSTRFGCECRLYEDPPADFVQRFPTINSHPALLPDFPGAHAVRDALNAQVGITGATVHWVDAGVDTGPIITSMQVPIVNGDTEEILHERIKKVERALIVASISLILPTLETHV